MALTPQIEHHVDVIEGPGGAVEECYNFLLYRFATNPPTVARHYLGDGSTVSLISTHPAPDEVLEYLRTRFDRVQQLTRQGYVENA